MHFANIKVLYLCTNRIYINDNLQLFPLLFRSLYNTKFYGPGFVSKEILDKGISYFEKINGPFDIVVTDAVILFWNIESGHLPFSAGHNYFKYEECISSFKEMKNFYNSCDIPVKIFYPNFDFYHAKPQNINDLSKVNPFIIARDRQFWRYKHEMKELANETFQSNATDNWINYVEENQHLIISFPGIINNTEFTYHPLHERKYDITVPGAHYHHRKEAFRVLNNNKTIKWQKRGSIPLRKFDNLIRRTWKSRLSLSWYKTKFNMSIEDSKMVFTCGSALGFPLRKFIEIPAKGAMLICVPFYGFKNFGFVNNENCIVCYPKDLIKTVTYFKENNSKAQEISLKGQEFIWNKHSFIARQNQLKQVISCILSNKFDGTYWKNGDFIIKH
jgi:Glycosyl transferases group 1